MMGSTTRGGAAVPSSGSVALSAAILLRARSNPDPSGPGVQFPTTAVAQAKFDQLTAALGPGQQGEHLEKILETAVWAATSSFRVNVAATTSALTVIKYTLVGVKTKLNSDSQLSQQTLGRLMEVEKTVLDGIQSAVSLGHLGGSGEEDEEASKKEQLIKLVTVPFYSGWRVREKSRCGRGAGGWGCPTGANEGYGERGCLSDSLCSFNLTLTATAVIFAGLHVCAVVF